jgi:hypothetical protein
MARFEPDIGNVAAATPIYEGLMELKVISAKGFAYENDEGDERAGVEYRFEVVGQRDPQTDELDRTDAGKPISSHRVWLHTDKAWPMAKSFVMAAMGFVRTAAGEEEFNKKYATKKDWHVVGEGDDVEVGSGWELPVGQIVLADCEPEDIDEDRQRQGFKRFLAAEA